MKLVLSATDGHGMNFHLFFIRAAEMKRIVNNEYAKKIRFKDTR